MSNQIKTKFLNYANSMDLVERIMFCKDFKVTVDSVLDDANNQIMKLGFTMNSAEPTTIDKVLFDEVKSLLAEKETEIVALNKTISNLNAEIEMLKAKTTTSVSPTHVAVTTVEDSVATDKLAKIEELNKHTNKDLKNIARYLVKKHGLNTDPNNKLKKDVINMLCDVDIALLKEGFKAIKSEEAEKKKENKKEVKPVITTKEAVVTKEPKTNQWNLEGYNNNRKFNAVAGNEISIISMIENTKYPYVVGGQIAFKGKVCHFSYSKHYELPMLLGSGNTGKFTKEELAKVKQVILNSELLPKSFKESNAVMLSNVEGFNGWEKNFYYNELEEGKYIIRFKEYQGETQYMGYINGTVFYWNRKNHNGKIVENFTSVAATSYFKKDFSPAKEELVNNIIALKERAFGEGHLKMKDITKTPNQTVLDSKKEEVKKTPQVFNPFGNCLKSVYTKKVQQGE